MKKWPCFKAPMAIVLAVGMMASLLTTPMSGIVASADPAPLNLALTFRDVDSGNNWFFNYTQSNSIIPSSNQFYTVTATIDSTDTRTVLMEYAADQKGFYIYPHCFNPVPSSGDSHLPTTSFSIAQGAILTPVATSDWTAIAGGQAYTLTGKVDIKNIDGAWQDSNVTPPEPPTYAPLDISTISVNNAADQTGKSYITLDTAQDLLPAGDGWWNNYDSSTVVVTIDGVEHAAAFGGGGSAQRLAVYLPWATGESNLLASAHEIIIKAGSKANVGSAGIQFSSDLRVYKIGNAWKTDYIPVPNWQSIDTSKALEVVVSFKDVNAHGALELDVATASGDKIKLTYGDWTTAWGTLKFGVANGDGTYTFIQDVGVAYSITDGMFYLDNLPLGFYDAIEFDTGSIVYPDSSCQSQNPMKIVNSLRIVRNANDQWVEDESFTTKPVFPAGVSDTAANHQTGDRVSTDTAANPKTGDSGVLSVGLDVLAASSGLLMLLSLIGRKRKRNNCL